MARPLVSIIIFNRNGKRFLRGCIEAVMKQSFKDFNVTLFDDNSSDGSVVFVRDNFPSVNILTSNRNIGIAAAQNRAYKKAKGKYIVSLHNDTVADKEWLSKLVIAMESVGNNVACIEGGVYHDRIGDIHGNLNVVASNSTGKFYDSNKKFYSGTCSMIIRNNLLSDYFDEDYYFYGEDVYLGWLLRLKGYDIRREPKSKVRHFGTMSATSMRIKRTYQFFSERNRVLNYFLFFEKGTIIKLSPLLLFSILYNIFSSVVGSRWKLMPNIMAYSWVLANLRKIVRKRDHIQKQRVVRDTNILMHMTSRIFSGNSSVFRLINWMSIRYCRIIGIKTSEFS